jgi:hypothetical protein
MSPAALVNAALFWFVVVLALLLTMFVYAVIAMPAEDAVPTGPPTPHRPAHAASQARRQPGAAPAAADTTGPAGGDGPAAGAADAGVLRRDEVHRPDVSGAPPWDLEPAEREVIHRPQVSGKPPWEPAAKPPWLNG